MDDDRFTQTLANLPGAQDAVPERLAVRSESAVRRAVGRRRAVTVQKLGAVGAVAAASYGIFGVVARPSLAETVRKAVAAAAGSPRQQMTEYQFGTNGKLIDTVWRSGDFTKGWVREETRDRNGLRRLDIWRDGRHWFQAGSGAATLVESAAPVDFRGDLFLHDYEKALRSEMGKRLQEIEPRTEAGRKLRVFVMPIDSRRQLQLFFDAETQAMVRSDELDVLGTRLVLRRRVDVAQLDVYEASRFAPLPNAITPEALAARVTETLRSPVGTLRGNRRTLAVAPVLRNPHGDLFVLYRDTVPKGDPNPSSLQIDGPYCQPRWFDLKVGKAPVSVGGDGVRGRWFVARTEGAAPPTVTLRYQGETLRVRPQPIPAEMPFYGGLFELDLHSPWEYLRSIDRAEDARLRHDPTALLSAADAALAVWPSLPAPYDTWLRGFALQDRSWALRCQGDGAGADAALAEAKRVSPPDAGVSDPFHRATGWER